MGNRISRAGIPAAGRAPRPVTLAAVSGEMARTVAEFFERVLGLGIQASDLRFGHMAARAFVVFVVGVTLARWAYVRVLGHNARFDIMLLVVRGSVLSRAVNGQAAFFPTLGASALLILLHH